jgi:hypothetical protein
MTVPLKTGNKLICLMSYSYVVQVFEANIRLLGGLLSAHLLMEDSNFPGLSPDWYLGMGDLPSVFNFN